MKKRTGLLTFTAFDDQTSTFILPSGGGFEVVFCPMGRSTTILTTLSAQLHELASTGHVTSSLLADTQNITIIRGKNAGVTWEIRAWTLGVLFAAVTVAIDSGWLL